MEKEDEPRYLRTLAAQTIDDHCSMLRTASVSPAREPRREQKGRTRGEADHQLGSVEGRDVAEEVACLGEADEVGERDLALREEGGISLRAHPS